MKKILLTIFVVIVVAITSVGVYYVASPLDAQEFSYEVIKDSIKASKAYIIREEEVYSADASGTLYNNVSDGERICANSLLTTIYHADISGDTLKTLKTVDKKILTETDKRNRITSYGIDSADPENTVAAIVKEIPEAAQKDNIGDIAQYKEMINNIRSGVETNEEDKLAALYAEKASIEESINSSKSEIRTNIAGVFTTYIDGLESFLKVPDIKTYTPSYIASLPQVENERLTNVSVDSGAPVCKVVNNHVWYLIMAVPEEKIAACEVGDSVTLTLDTIDSEEIDGEIYYKSEPEDGKVLVTVKCSNYLEGAFSYRETSAELIFESYRGYKVPVYAVRTDENGEKYVVCRSGAKEYKCYCTIDYTNVEEEYIIINSTPNASKKLEDVDQIVVGEK